MRKWIEDLLDLQNSDLRIRGLKMRLEMIPAEKEKLAKELETEKTELKEAKDSLQKTEMDMKSVESDIKAQNEKISKLQNQSVMVKKNEEYKALMSEIDGCKAKISDYETTIIGLLDKQEEEQAEFKKDERTFSEKEKNIKDGIAELDEAVGEIKEEIKRVESGRSGLEAKIETPILTEYRRLLGKNKGQPLAPIHDENCGNCHLKLTPQTITEARKGAVARCDHCAHMLYIQS